MASVENGKKKPQMSLIDPQLITELSEVLMRGNERHGYQNWMYMHNASHSEVIDAVLRHVMAYSAGEDIDPDSGHNHLVHAIARLMILNWYRNNAVGNDDRPFVSY